MMVEITSRQNPLYKEVKSIISDLQADLIVVEGKKLFLEAVNSSCKLAKIIVDKKNSAEIIKLIDTQLNPEIIYMENDLISSLYTTDSSPTTESPVIAFVARPNWNLNDIIASGKHISCLVDVQDPGNVGTVLRSALAFDTAGIFLLGSCAKPFNTKTIRASAGAVFKLPCIELSDYKTVFAELKNKEYQVVATSSKSSLQLRDLKKGKQLFLFGNEGKGLPEEILNQSDVIVKIPHSKNVESLNLAASANIVFWEMYKKSL
ncbi:MAG: RNA methyltransferase [Candidatus Melainabacteria bacterium]|nr:RNA methyltransferase [Candidatus Melainabacteria bacterium]MBI3308218.1 RNA methyltransferase [Candidatus Melainabacteria bacterium]